VAATVGDGARGIGDVAAGEEQVLVAEHLLARAGEVTTTPSLEPRQMEKLRPPPRRMAAVDPLEIRGFGRAAARAGSRRGYAPQEIHRRRSPPLCRGHRRSRHLDRSIRRQGVARQRSGHR